MSECTKRKVYEREGGNSGLHGDERRSGRGCYRALRLGKPREPVKLVTSESIEESEPVVIGWTAFWRCWGENVDSRNSDSALDLRRLMVDTYWCADSVAPCLSSGLGFNAGGMQLRVVGDPLETRELEGFAVPWSRQLGNVTVVAC